MSRPIPRPAPVTTATLFKEVPFGDITRGLTPRQGRARGGTIGSGAERHPYPTQRGAAAQMVEFEEHADVDDDKCGL